MKKSSASSWLCSGTVTPGGTTPRIMQYSSFHVRNSKVGPRTSKTSVPLPDEMSSKTRLFVDSILTVATTHAEVWNFSAPSRDGLRPRITRHVTSTMSGAFLGTYFES